MIAPERRTVSAVERGIAAPFVPRNSAPPKAEKRAQDEQNRIADKITAFSGSMAFVYVHILWFGLWFGLGVEKYPFGSSPLGALD